LANVFIYLKISQHMLFFCRQIHQCTKYGEWGMGKTVLAITRFKMRLLKNMSLLVQLLRFIFLIITSDCG
jgi:hypothetical protein